MKQIEKALKLAHEVHKDQVDKAGSPYILHPLTVSHNSRINTENEKIAAILHDVIEDGNVTFDYLEVMGFGNKVIEALKFLTKPTGVDYFDYIRNIKCRGSAIAYFVKLADLEHNMDLSRISNPTEKDIQRAEKYKKALNILVGIEE